MFENLKNLINKKHHGKKASHDMTPSKSESSASVSDGSYTPNGPPKDSETYASDNRTASTMCIPSPASSRNSSMHLCDSPVSTESSHRLFAENELNQKYPDLDSRYQLMEKIGDGAFSKVYKALDTATNTVIAVKIIDKSSTSTTQLNNVLKEISIMRTLDHPNIIKLLAFKNTTLNCFLFLELVDGGEIFNQIIKLTYFSEDLARHVIVQVARAVKYLHEEIGVVHRDIKPENLLFTEIPFVANPAGRVVRASDDDSKLDEGKFCPGIGGGSIGIVKLADFGLSKVLWDRKTQTPCGTAGYTAPEIMNDLNYDKAVDVWSLGCVLYTLLCGFPPFYDTDQQKLANKIVAGDYCFLSPWWDEISKEAKDLVTHLLTLDPVERYTVDELLCHPWVLQNNKATEPALDAPQYSQAQPEGLFDKDYFNTAMDGLVTTPRAEAIRFVFDNNSLPKSIASAASRNRIASTSTTLITVPSQHGNYSLDRLVEHSSDDEIDEAYSDDEENEFSDFDVPQAFQSSALKGKAHRRIHSIDSVGSGGYTMPLFGQSPIKVKFAYKSTATTSFGSLTMNGHRRARTNSSSSLRLRKASEALSVAPVNKRGSGSSPGLKVPMVEVELSHAKSADTKRYDPNLTVTVDKSIAARLSRGHPNFPKSPCPQSIRFRCGPLVSDQCGAGDSEDDEANSDCDSDSDMDMSDYERDNTPSVIVEDRKSASPREPSTSPAVTAQTDPIAIPSRAKTSPPPMDRHTAPVPVDIRKSFDTLSESFNLDQSKMLSRRKTVGGGCRVAQ